MTCAKVIVTAQLTTVDGQQFFGSNYCVRPQYKCPREPGEDYAKCTHICMQEGHAEIVAIKRCRAAGFDANGGHMKVGHKRVCDACQKTMKANNITWELV